VPVLSSLDLAVSGRKGACEREMDRLGKHLDRIGIMVGFELGEVDGGLAADEDATDEAGPIPGDPVPLGIRADDEMGTTNLHEGGRCLMTHGEVLCYRVEGEVGHGRAGYPAMPIRSGRRRRSGSACGDREVEQACTPVGSGR